MSTWNSTLINDRYQTIEKTKFNGKEENGKKPWRMTPHLWKLEYNRHRHGMQIVYVAYKYVILWILYFYWIFSTMGAVMNYC